MDYLAETEPKIKALLDAIDQDNEGKAPTETTSRILRCARQSQLSSVESSRSKASIRTEGWMADLQDDVLGTELRWKVP